MKVTNFPEKMNVPKSTLIMGGFESIHNGHIELIDKAKELKLPIVIMVIESKKHGEDWYYEQLDIRLQNLANLDIDYSVVIKLTPDVLRMSGSDFLNKMIDLYNVANIVAGADFAFGRDRAFDTKELKQNFDNTFIVPIMKINTKKIGTGLLREMVTLGEVDAINQVSPFRFKIKADINSDSCVVNKGIVIPQSGIYTCFIVVRDIKYFAVVHVNLNDVIKVYSPSLLIENNPYKCVIEFHNLSRIIIKSSNDFLRDGEIKNIEKDYILSTK